jgi:transcriptional regulator with XRE-family HTH domain
MNTTILSPYPSSSAIPIKNTQAAPAAVKLVASLLFFAAGTGGNMTPHSIAEVQDRWSPSHYPRIRIEHSVPKNGDMRSPAEHVANIRDVLGINMSDLASILGVTRPTVYAWYEGQEPKTEAVTHIQRLSRISDEIKRINIIRIDKLIHRPILDGRSLLDILKTDEDPVAALVTLKAVADKEEQTRREQKGSGKNLRSLDDMLRESSVPIYERS